jgi:hypothetical protein
MPLQSHLPTGRRALATRAAQGHRTADCVTVGMDPRKSMDSSRRLEPLSPMDRARSGSFATQTIPRQRVMTEHCIHCGMSRGPSIGYACRRTLSSRVW